MNSHMVKYLQRYQHSGKLNNVKNKHGRTPDDHSMLKEKNKSPEQEEFFQ